MSIFDNLKDDRDALLLAIEEYKESALRGIEDAEKDVLARLKKAKEDTLAASATMTEQIESAYGKPEKPITSDDFVVVKDDIGA